jgi:hypothetical protein
VAAAKSEGALASAGGKGATPRGQNRREFCPLWDGRGGAATAESEGVSATAKEDGAAAAESGGQLRPPRERMLSRWRNRKGSSCHHERGGQQRRSATARERAATQRRSATEEGRNNAKSGREEGGGIGRVGWWSSGCKEE